MPDISVQHSQIRDINEDFESRKQDLKNEHEEKIRQTQKAYLKHEQDVRESGDAAINHIRRDSQKRVETEAAIIHENADQVLARADNESKQKIKTIQENGIGTSESLRRQYSKDISNTQRKGETDLTDTKQKYDRELRNEEAFYKGEIDTDKKRFSDDQLKSQTQYEQKRKETSELQRKNLNQLIKKYNEQFAQNQNQNQESFALQKQNFLREIYRQQQDLSSKTSAIESKLDDPFYQTRDLKARLVEHDGAFELRAQIPKPERGSYSVHVKDDKIILEAYRSNESKIEEGNETSSTNSYQTYRQEFKLNYPVQAHLAVKQIDDDGNLSVTVPKKQLGA